MNKKTNPHTGSSFDEFLEAEGILAETEAVAVKRVVAWQLEEFMKNEGLSRTAMARRMKTSRSSLNRLLDPENNSVTLATLERAARAIGRRVQIRIV